MKLTFNLILIIYLSKEFFLRRRKENFQDEIFKRIQFILI